MSALATLPTIQAEAPVVGIRVVGASQLSEALRRLPPMDRIPPGCHVMCDRGLRGAFLVVDPTARSMVRGSNFLLQWNKHRPPSVNEIRWTDGSLGRRPHWMLRAPFVPDGLPAMCDNLSPASFDRVVVGKVVGILCNRDGSPMTELWAEQDDRAEKTTAPSSLPETYAMTCVGDCLMPVYATGTKFLFWSKAPRRVGDFVALWRKPELTGSRQYQCLIKRLLTPIPRRWTSRHQHMPPVILVETLNPKRTWVVPMDQLAAVHRCKGAYSGPTHPI